MLETVYKVCRSGDWQHAEHQGQYLGSVDDLRDGFIHLSTARQLAGTLQRHFSAADGRAMPDLVLVAFDPARLGPELRWEAARDGSLFPHLYAPLPASLAGAVRPLTIGPDGRHVLEGIATHA